MFAAFHITPFQRAGRHSLPEAGESANREATLRPNNDAPE
jgi:hypothetical protein